MEFDVCRVKTDGFIAKEKNKLLKSFVRSSKDAVFLVEDNCQIVNDGIYQKFIDCHQKTGIHALMWGKGTPNKRLEFDEDRNLEYWADFSPVFTFYTKEAIKKAGFFDEEMPPNTYQEMEHAKRIGDAELSTPFGMFASPQGIENMLSIESPRKINHAEAEKALIYWEEKDGNSVTLSMRDDLVKMQSITEMI